MENLIDHTYFRGDITIANANEAGPVQSMLLYYIAEHQRVFLVKLMGPVLYARFTNWYMNQDADEKWSELVNGKVFTSQGGYPMDWSGFKNDLKLSPLANYVYWKYQARNATQTVSSGEANTQMENAYPGIPKSKMVAAWNGMVDMLLGYWEYMEQYFTDDADWKAYRVCGASKELYRRQNVLGI